MMIHAKYDDEEQKIIKNVNHLAVGSVLLLVIMCN
jgi:hypothetical protein